MNNTYWFFEGSPDLEPALNLRQLLLTLVVAYCIYAYVQRRREYQADKAFADQHGCLPMEKTLPYKWPFAIDVLKRQYDALPSQRLLAFQSQFFDKMGPNMKLMLFGQAGYMTTDPKNVEAVLSSCFEDFGLGSRREGLFPLLGEGIFTQDGRAWKHSRETLRRQFVRMQYQNTKVFDGHVNDLIASLSSSPGVVDLQPAFFRYTLSTTTSLIFGEPPNGSEYSERGIVDQDAFATSFDYASMISAIRLRLADLCWLYTPSKFRRACDDVKAYAAYFVQQALNGLERNGEEAASQRHPFIIDLYRDLKDASLVRDQLVHVLIAGRDTTACLMSWTFYLLVRHPEALNRLYQETRDVVGDDQEVTRAQINKMPFLRCVLNETSRLYPQLPVNVRIATKTTLIPSGGGPDGQSPVLLRRGTGVGWSTYHMHRQTSIYGPDASEFRPERWDGTDLEKKVGWGFLPFHGGPRICLGKDFALMEASYGIVRILQKFPNVRLPPDVPVEPTGQEKQNLTVVVSSAEGCKVLLD